MSPPTFVSHRVFDTGWSLETKRHLRHGTQTSLNQLIYKKLKKLERILGSFPGVVVAFSGGVDSSVLLLIARDVLKKKVIAMTAHSPTYPAGEIENAKKIARKLKVKHLIFKTDELNNRTFVRNPHNRCYYCKIELFGRMRQVALKHGFAVLEGSNKSDLNDYRPGMHAAKKLGVMSPLIEVGLTKQEIRKLAKKLGLPNWNQPSTACLASRIPYGRRIDRSTLDRIDRAERYLWQLGLTQVRVRDHYPVARIEVPVREFEKIIKASGLVRRRFMKLGYKFVTLDLAGYRTGSMNITLGYP